MFEKIDLKVLIVEGGLFTIHQVFRLQEDFFINYEKQDFVKLKPTWETSLPKVHWLELDGEKFRLIQKGHKLELK